MKADIEQIIFQSIEDMFERQVNLRSYTEDSSETEWNLTHHLANEVKRWFPWYDCDVELTKEGAKRPDILVHKRGNHRHNFLVIEAKKDLDEIDQEDKQKIEGKWFSDTYNYQFGVLASINFDEDHMLFVLENNEP